MLAIQLNCCMRHFCFFFSSRRRHTRSLCDWSSDVCSSDLLHVPLQLRNPQQVPTPEQLEPLEFELQRYMKHLHVGPYQALPQKWKDLKAELEIGRASCRERV